MAIDDDGIMVSGSAGSIMSDSKSKRTRVLFLAWGDSIHARRRIQIFIDDPAFEVIIVSTHDYRFSGAENILLRSVSGYSFVGQILRSIRYLSSDLLLFRLLEDTWKSLIDLVQLVLIANKKRPDVIFLQTMLYPCYLALFLPRSIPLIVTFWNGDITWWAKWDGVERLLKKQIVTWGVRRALAITVNSQAAFDACLGYGAQADKVHLIRYPGVDMRRFHPADKQVARRKLDMATEHVVFAPRGLGSYLNSDVIIDAAKLVVRYHPGVMFVISCAIASNDELEKHKSKSISLGIEKNCRWIPKIAWEEMPDYYNAADVMVSISSNDSLPNCMLEAMACGTPIIMGDIPQIRECVLDGQNGFLVPPRDSKLLSERILNIFGTPSIVGHFATENKKIVEREMDSVKNGKLIKDLVFQVASTGTYRYQ